MYGACVAIVVSKLTLWACRVISRIRCLNRSTASGAIRRQTAGPSLKLNPRNFRSCGRATALCLIHFEFELLRDESLHAFHHSLSRPFAANVNVAVVRVSNETKTPTLQLPVEFVKHEIAEQRQKWT